MPSEGKRSEMALFSRGTLATSATCLALCAPALALGQSRASAHPYQVEWVYRVRYGYQDEWWRIFQEYQIAILDREQQLGFVTSYVVVRPSLHTSEDARWDYRIEISYPSYEGATHEHDVEKQLFPNRTLEAREEQRRWELTLSHWDLPIHDIDPHAAPD